LSQSENLTLCMLMSLSKLS